MPFEQVIAKPDADGYTSKSIEKDSTTAELRLYDFTTGCSDVITSADISGDNENGILYRKIDNGQPVLHYMHFDSLDELAKKYIGDC